MAVEDPPSEQATPAAARPRRERPRYGRRRVCSFCADHIKVIDYKEVERLRRFLSDRAKIEPRRKTGTCAKHQRRLAIALKRARHLALLPFAAGHVRVSGGVGVRL
jgi:small subunit ribosomal protein S18